MEIASSSGPVLASRRRTDPRRERPLFLHQQGLDTTTPAGERVRAGLARARSEGKRLGRPPIAAELEKAIREALNQPEPTEAVRRIAERFGVNAATVQRISRPFAGASVAVT